MKRKTLTAAVLSTAALATFADVKPSQLFSNNMVIQRDIPAAIWGSADAGESVTVTGSWGATASTVADDNGEWSVKLQTPEAGGPHTLTFNGNNTVERTNVLSGDVWLCSGQSNMAWKVSQAKDPELEQKIANLPEIRHFKVKANATTQTASDVQGDWQVCSPETVSNFSATAYFTGRELHAALDVPIGLLNSSWGGTRIESWINADAQQEDPFVVKSKQWMDKKAEQFDQKTVDAKFKKDFANWKKKVAQAKKQNKKKRIRRPKKAINPHTSQHYPSNLYNGMIAPLIPYSIKGAIWYQGEANTKSVSDAVEYRDKLDTMITTWRQSWSNDFPFYFVQLPNFKNRDPKSTDKWPIIRESFDLVSKTTPKTGMAVTIDIGETDNIHPKNKQEVGRRLASTILNKTYGKSTPLSPIFESAKVSNGEIILTFKNNTSGLTSKGGALKSFMIAGEDRQFVEAKAVVVRRKIKTSFIPFMGDKFEDIVIVRSDKVQEPVAVRYAWANDPNDCNLYSLNGFPVAPFRTDNFEFADK